ncbi:NAD(P)-dependent dehydrogenase, short-chain alcohol dehydrogenase family [Muriicola jejuensis]|uniref:SDR family oxidoreductase n=1 Tax=Muriicola jejuensis TaxID=504488 RepID=A0A6P0UEP3_9FLAO|nr:SDR family oxidoreductase [Muriicola jejuensis]NER11477.1 SDR family oxidoreductase [Muriicola jejuensis]SMP20461.1 NAD(P)-dependent dehydrogenase, short-chain alcohol dehydrogenase family [Muriicola jejuensis]
MTKNILLIGGSHGIGLELVRLLHETHNVFVASRTAEDLSSLSVTHIPFDVTKDDLDLSKLPESLHGFVFCPGSINLKPMKMMGLDAFREDMEINFFSLVKVTKEVMPRMAESSSVVFFSTVAVGVGMPFHTSVAAAKGAIEGFAKALAAEYTPKVRVNVIAPSLVDTPLASRLLNNDRKKEMMAERHPLKRVGTAADIAHMAAFLLKEESGWMTGQILGVDGGMSTLNIS